MSIGADLIEILVSGGRGTDDLILVARAMERGPDAAEIYRLVDDLIDEDVSLVDISAAMCERANSIIERNTKRARVPRDNFSSERDSNRSRRGISNSVWRSIRLSVFERDGFACQYCGSAEDLTCDHIVPLIRGGTNNSENLKTACRSCNSSKGDKLIEEWRAQWA